MPSSWFFPAESDYPNVFRFATSLSISGTHGIHFQDKNSTEQPKMQSSDQIAISTKEKAVVIFDGDCNFCRSQIRALRFLDFGNRHFTFLSLHEPSVQVDFKQLKHEDLMQEMHIVDRENHVYAGAESVKYIVRKLPVLWIIAPLIYFPGTAPIWRALYRFIARNRYRIAGKNCDSGSCKLP